MKDFIVGVRNSVIRVWYRWVMKPFFFRHDAEMVHDRVTFIGAKFGEYAIARWVTKVFFGYSNKKLENKVLGISFANPVGLAAGFDKEGQLTDILPSVGFGFEEIGSVTGYPCEGNPKPRLWRLKKSKSLVVYYGLKNRGCEVIAAHLKTKKFKNRIGTSVAMTNWAKNNDIAVAIEDYAKAFKAFAFIGDYFTINISCPNTQGGQPFLDPANLDHLLEALKKINTNKVVFIKLSPDMSVPTVDAILDVAKKHRVHGIICTNLTKKRNMDKIYDVNVPKVGGLSGKLVSGLSDELIAHIYRRHKDRFVIVGVGGIFSAEDAYKKIRLGASLVQLITGMIFEGPHIVSEVNRGLVKLLKRDGFANINEVIGVDAI